MGPIVTWPSVGPLPKVTVRPGSDDVRVLVGQSGPGSVKLTREALLAFIGCLQNALAWLDLVEPPHVPSSPDPGDESVCAHCELPLHIADHPVDIDGNLIPTWDLLNFGRARLDET